MSEETEKVETSNAMSSASSDVPQDVLVVVSKLKAYIRATSGMSTSDAVIPVLSDHLRRLCDAAVQSAAAERRKTVMDRDFSSQLGSS